MRSCDKNNIREVVGCVGRWRDQDYQYGVSEEYDDGDAVSKWNGNRHRQHDLLRTTLALIKNGKRVQRNIIITI